MTMFIISTKDQAALPFVLTLAKRAVVSGFSAILVCSLVIGCRKSERIFSENHHTHIKESIPTTTIEVKPASLPVVTLIIGISEYKHRNDLRNPVNDARLISERLKSIHIESEAFIDLTGAGLRQKLQDFRQQLKQGPIAMGFVFFAGHGKFEDSQMWLLGSDYASDERNMLPPKITKAQTVPSKSPNVTITPPALPLSDILACEEDAKGGLIVFLDCCRTMTNVDILKKESEKVRPRTHVTYSTLLGEPAYDGPPGGHSIFAEKLAELLTSTSNLGEINKQLEKAMAFELGSIQKPDTIGDLQKVVINPPGKLLDVPVSSSVHSPKTIYSEPTSIADKYSLEFLISRTSYRAAKRNVKSALLVVIQRRLGLPINTTSTAGMDEAIRKVQRKYGHQQDGLITNELLTELRIPHSTFDAVSKLRQEVGTILSNSTY